MKLSKIDDEDESHWTTPVITISFVYVFTLIMFFICYFVGSGSLAKSRPSCRAVNGNSERLLCRNRGRPRFFSALHQVDLLQNSFSRSVSYNRMLFTGSKDIVDDGRIIYKVLVLCICLKASLVGDMQLADGITLGAFAASIIPGRCIRIRVPHQLLDGRQVHTRIKA